MKSRFFSIIALLCIAVTGAWAQTFSTNGTSQSAGKRMTKRAPSVNSNWLYYDNGLYENTIGAGGSDVYWAIMLPAESLPCSIIEKISMFEHVDWNTEPITLKIYSGGDNAPAGSPIYTATFNPAGVTGFHEITLASPVTVDMNQNVWIVMKEYGTYPATVCTDTNDRNGRWISLDGQQWEDMADYGLYYSWMLRAKFAMTYDLSVGTNDHGTVKFMVNNEEKTKAGEGELVTVTVTADEGWAVGSVTASTYATWEAAGARRLVMGSIPMLGDVTLTPVADKENTWTFTMPAANVQVSATYIPVAAFAPAEPSGTLVPTAAEGVIAGEDKAIIVAGTVANIPETTNPQGTVKYFVTDNKDMTAEQAAKANGWVEALPTAAGYTGSYADDFQVYVWYYIQAATGYADSEPQRIEVTVKKNLFDIDFNAANGNTFDATQASKGTVTVSGTDKTGAITNGKLQGVKMESKVTINAKRGYKFRKVEVKKGEKLTLTVGDMVLDITGCTTWADVVAKNSDKIEENGPVVVQKDNHDKYIGPSVTTSSPVDTSVNYQWYEAY